jgi:hypothetical protein
MCLVDFVTSLRYSGGCSADTRFVTKGIPSVESLCTEVFLELLLKSRTTYSFISSSTCLPFSLDLMLYTTSSVPTSHVPFSSILFGPASHPPPAHFSRFAIRAPLLALILTSVVSVLLLGAGLVKWARRTVATMLWLELDEGLGLTACGAKTQHLPQSVSCACRRTSRESLARQDSHVDIAWDRGRAERTPAATICKCYL